MAGFATEALAHGCAVIVGSYGVAEIQATPAPNRRSLLCHPDALGETLAGLVTNREERSRRSESGESSSSITALPQP